LTSGGFRIVSDTLVKCNFSCSSFRDIRGSTNCSTASVT